MPTYISYRCPSCKAHIELQDAYQSVGPPFVACNKCGKEFDVSKNRTEWDLKTPNRKVLFHLKVAFISVWLGIGTGLLLADVTTKYLSVQIPWFVAVPIGVAGWFWLLSADLRRNISESKARMRDPSYRERLRGLGIQLGEQE